MCEICYGIATALAKWDRSYINNLPDAAFAVIEPDYRSGKTANKNARHLPHHSDGVKDGRNSKDHIDLPHLRNALARADQIKPVTPSISTSDLRRQATSHLEKHAKDLGIGGREKPGGQKAEEPADSHGGGLVFRPSLAARAQLPARSYPLGFEPQVELQDGSSGLAKVFLTASLPRIEIAEAQRQTLIARLQEGGPSFRETLKPAEDDYIDFAVRALSKVLIRHSKWLDFTIDGVLEKAAPLLAGRTLFANHVPLIQEWVGVAKRSWWDGESDPPGINAELRVDALANPKIARGLLTDPPAVSRVSVTPFIRWKKSHAIDDFWQRLGQEVDSEIVRILVAEVEDFGEISLVWYGADPGAKRIVG
jgi:hypothetical protein